MVLQAMESTNSNKPVVKVPVGISARHIHLTQEDVEKLFGKGYQLTKKKELMGGQFASNELRLEDIRLTARKWPSMKKMEKMQSHTIKS